MSNTVNVNGKEVEFGDIICHTVNTHFSIMDRIKLLFSGNISSTSWIHTKEVVNIVKEEATCHVCPLVIKKSMGMMQKLEPILDEPAN